MSNIKYLPYIFLFLLNFTFAQETIIIQDDLQGSTVGTKVGGSFSSEGYKPGIGNSHILYVSPNQVINGYVEFQIKGFSPSLISDTEANNGFVGLYDGRGINEPIQYFNDFKENFFRWNFHWRQNKDAFKAVINCAEPTADRLNETKAVFTLENSPENPDYPGIPTRDWFSEPTGNGWSWNSSTWYTVKVEWKDKTFKAYVNGTQVWVTSGPYDYAPIDFKIWLGSAPGSGNKYTNSVQDIVYRNFKLVSYGGSSGTTPSAPSNLTASTVNDTRIDLDWTDNADDENGFKIERKIGSGGTWSQIATVGSNVTSYQNTGLSSNTTYYYRVRAYNSSGNSSYSNEANETTNSGIPAAPSDLSANVISSTQVNLHWTDNADNEDGFKIFREIGLSDSVDAVIVVAANTIEYKDTNLTPYTEYLYRVKSYNAAGTSWNSNEVIVTTNDTVPSAPSNLAASVSGSTQIDLTWTDNSDNEDGFKIDRKTGSDGTWAEVGMVGVDITEYQDTNLTPNTTYYYRVKAFNSAGNSSNSNEANSTTDNVIPSAPSDLVAEAVSSTQINLSWTDNSDNEEGSKIDRKTGSDGTWTEVGMVGADITEYQDTNLTPNTTYYYRVKAFNSAGNSNNSNEANIIITGINELQSSNVRPDDYMLFNNYPNPFNPSTTIQFGLPEESIVSLSIYDIAGRRVENILSDEVLPAGIFRYKFNPHNLPSGIYLYVLVSSSNISKSNFKDVKKMILLK